MTVSQEGTVSPTEVRPLPPVRVQTRVVPLNDSPDPRVISEGAAALPVGLPRIVEALSLWILEYVTALAAIFPVEIAPDPIVMTPVDVTSVASPDMVNPPNDPALSYWIWPDEPPGVL